MNSGFDLFGIAILIATFAGPIVAVLMTRFIDSRREYRERQKNIFKILMVNRASALNAENIQALNMVEIDFARNQKVVAAWHKYFDSLRSALPSEEAGTQDLFAKRRNLYVLLLHSMAEELGYKFDQINILDGGYYPNGAIQIEAENQAVRQLFAGIARGERNLPVSIKNAD